MANIQFKDAAASTKELKATGDGSGGDPFIPSHAIEDGGGSITVDNAVLSVVGGGTEAAAQRVTIANDSTGVLSVDDNGGSLTVDNGGTFATQETGAALTALQLIDDAVFVDDAAFTPATSKVVGIGMEFDDSSPDSVDEGDVGMPRMSARREQYMQIRDAAGNERGANVDASNRLGVVLSQTLTVTDDGAFSLAANDGVDVGDVTVNNGSGGAAVNVQDGGNSLTVDNPALSVVNGGAEATALRVTLANDSTGLLSVDDNGASLTVDNPALSVTGGGAEATALRVTLANDSSGLVSVDDNGASLTVDNGGTFAVQESGGALTALQLLDDAVFTDDAAFTPASSKVLGVGMEFDDASPNLVDEGDIGIPRMSDRREQYMQIRDAAGNERGANVNGSGQLAVSVDNNPVLGASTNNIGDVDVLSLPAIPAGTNNIGDVDVLTLPALPAGTNNIGDVDVLTLPALPAGTNNIGDVDVLSIAAGDNNIGNVDIASLPNEGQQTMANSISVAIASDQSAVEVIGDIATDSPLGTNNPVAVGGRASTAVPSAVSADGDAVNIWTNRHGAPVVTQAPHVGMNGSPWDLVHEGAQYTSTQTSTVLVAGGASEKIVVTQIQIQAFGTTTFDLQVYFGTGAFSRGTSRTIFDGTFKPSSTSAPGVVMNGPFIAGANGDDILVTTSAAGSVTISVWYYVVT